MPSREPDPLPSATPRPPEPPVWATTLAAAPAAHDNSPRQPVLPFRLQAAVAVLIAVGLTGMAIWFVAAGGFSGGLVAYRDTHSSGPASNPTGFRVDLNTASRTELLQLPRVGPALADRIINRRQTVGPYASADDLLAVPGIGEITLADIRPFLRPLPAESRTPPDSLPSDATDDLRTGQ